MDVICPFCEKKHDGTFSRIGHTCCSKRCYDSYRATKRQGHSSMTSRIKRDAIRKAHDNLPKPERLYVDSICDEFERAIKKKNKKSHFGSTMALELVGSLAMFYASNDKRLHEEKLEKGLGSE